MYHQGSTHVPPAIGQLHPLFPVRQGHQWQSSHPWSPSERLWWFLLTWQSSVFRKCHQHPVHCPFESWRWQLWSLLPKARRSCRHNIRDSIAAIAFALWSCCPPLFLNEIVLLYELGIAGVPVSVPAAIRFVMGICSPTESLIHSIHDSFLSLTSFGGYGKMHQSGWIGGRSAYV